MTVFSNQKLLLATNGGETDFYSPIVLSAQDYYPFGMLMLGRVISSDNYRYSFNGFEKDNEVKGADNHLSFGDYGYDSRTGKRWNIDPASYKYSHQSPFSAFNNNPIYFLDPDGKEGVASVNNSNQTVTIKAVYFVEVGPNGFNQDNYNQLMRLNSTLNTQGYKVTDPNSQYNGYNVAFDLQFVPVNSEQNAQSFAVNEDKIQETGTTDFTVGGLPIGNSMILMSDQTFNAIPSIKETAEKHDADINQVMGITDASLQHINIPERSRGNVLTKLHEIFHTLYYNNDGATEGIGGGKEMPNPSDINGMMKGFQESQRIINE